MSQPNHASDVKLSGPLYTLLRPDVDFNGIGWSHRIGLCFPPQAMVQIPMRPPAPPSQPPRKRSGGSTGATG